jgi:AcrR family transcriptional regulator
MAQVSNNENNRFTKACIYEALWELLKQQPYSSITITQIAQKAGVSRNAIYRNFESKDDIIKKRLLECYRSFTNTLTQTNTTLSREEYVVVVCEHLCSQRDIAETLVRADLTEFLLESFAYVKGSYTTDTETEFYENYRIGGALFVYLTWILRGCKETPKQLADIVNHICSNPAIIPNLNTKP